MSDRPLEDYSLPYLWKRIAELDTENKRLKNRGTITSPMDGLFEENERLKAKLEAAEATIRRIEALFSEIEKIEAAGDDIHTPWLVIMFEEALGEAK